MSEIRRVNTGDAPRNVYHAGDAPRTVNAGRTVKTHLFDIMCGVQTALFSRQPPHSPHSKTE